jgi:hypothetical protein
MPGSNLVRLGVALLVFAGCAGWSATRTSGAQSRAAFGTASLIGTYALVGVGGAHEAASVGVTRFDGAGSLSRTLVLNEADPQGDGRVILTIPGSGSYTVTPDGSGSAVVVNELPDGSTVQFTFDFVITRAERQGAARAPLGLALHMVQREAGIAATLVTFDLTRLPD